jgi:multiple sugar transport system substrate-binding protein
MYQEDLAVNPKDLGLSWDGEVFAAGKCAMTTGGSWYIGMMKKAAPNTKYDIIPMPGQNGKNG